MQEIEISLANNYYIYITRIKNSIGSGWQIYDGISANIGIIALRRAVKVKQPKNPKILDNKQQGRVIDELRQGIQPGAKMSVISAFFTIYAYEELKKELSEVYQVSCDHIDVTIQG